MPMQSRTDQVHSYEFFLQRVVSGLVARESDPAELPFRRLGWAGFGSVMVAVLIAGVFGVIGVLAGGGATSWRDGESIVVEKGSGRPYLYRDGRLHPMANLVSAQLALGGKPNVDRVSARSIEGVPRGPTLGIAGAPAALPGPGDLLTDEWALCTEQRSDGSGGIETVSVLSVGRGPGGGEPFTDRALLVEDVSAADLHLVWRGHRFPLAEEADATLSALGVSRTRVRPVAPAWLDALPLGRPLGPPEDLPDPGEPTAAFGDPDDQPVRTGQVIEDQGRSFLVTSDELVEITPLQAQIVIRDDDYPGPAEAVPMVVPAGADVLPLPGRTEDSPPDQAPRFVAEDVLGPAVCAEFPRGEFVPEIRGGGRLPTTDAIETPGVTERGGLLADYVLVEGGRAALVQSVTAPEAAGGSWHIVTDQGIRYPLPTADIAGTFGYGMDQAVRVRAGLVDLLPAGPALDPADALKPVTQVDPASGLSEQSG